MDIFGITIDTFKTGTPLSLIRTYLRSNRHSRIATVNPEFLLEARRNKKFHNVLNSFEMRVADGFGIVLVHWFKGKKPPRRFPGADLVHDILQEANDQQLTVFLAILRSGLSNLQEVRDALEQIYPNISIIGQEYDVPSDVRTKVSTPQNIPDTCAIALCNFGAPEQEIFISRLKGASLKVSMGVGGSFDYMTGRIQRAPQSMQKLGLEWLWRFLIQPSRWKRIWNAVIVFPYYAIARDR